MKLVRTVLIGAFAAEASPNKCAADCKTDLKLSDKDCQTGCKNVRNDCPDGIYPVPGQCDAYFMCANGFQFPDQYCPDGLMFNGEVCDWPENVECGCNDGIYPVEDECAAYYVCHEGVQYPNQYCPDGLFFNEHQLVCDWPENVECGNSENDQVYWDCFKGCKKDTPTWLLWTCHAKCGETAPMTKTDVQAYCTDGIYKVDETCNAFYMCFHGFRTEIQYCPDGLLFNEELGACDWPDKVACSGPF